MEPIFIGVDTGNRCIKTASNVFVAGVKVSEKEPAFKIDTLIYNNVYYTLTHDRVAYLQDKTESEEYFALTLFAIAKELEEREIDTEAVVPIKLGVGLPPSHLERLKDSFKEYFNRGVVSFEYKDKTIKIDIRFVQVFSQAYAAIYKDFAKIRNFDEAYIVDIGGYTTDIIALHNGKVNPSVCRSIDMGLIQLYNKVSWKIHDTYGRNPSESSIDRAMATHEEIAPTMPILEIINDETTTYIAELLRKLAEFGVDLTFTKGIFVGGGSERFKPWIEKSEYVFEPYFITSIFANAQGYEALLAALNPNK